MDIPVNAKVKCSDGHGGRSTYVLIDPTAQQLTHLVVRESKLPHIERLVAIFQVKEATPTSINLSCTRDELAMMEHFIEPEYVWMTEPSREYLRGVYSMLPHSIPAEKWEKVVEHEHIPPGELAVSANTHIEATDGHVGRLDEFLVDARNGHITHLVLREGHLWGQKEVAISISEIERLREDTVYLRLDKHSIGELPSVPVRRWLHEGPHNLNV